MPNIYRLFGLAFICLLFFPANINSQSKPPSPTKSKPNQPPQQKTEDHNRPTEIDQRGTEKSPFVIKTQKTEAETAQDKQDREEKTTEQWWSKVTSGATILVGIFQAIILYLQLKFFKVQTESLKETVELSRDTAQRQLRAYVSVLGAMITPAIQVGMPFRISIKIKNNGQTPAYDLTSIARLAYGTSFQGTFTPQANGEPSRTNLGRDGTHEIFLPAEQPLTPEVFNQLNSGELKVFVFGKIHYRDAFDRCHDTTYRLMLNGANDIKMNRLSICQEGNEET